MNPEETLSANRGQKVSEVHVEPSDGKPPYHREIKTEAETVAELKGQTSRKISTEADPDYAEKESEDEDAPEGGDDASDKTTRD